MAKFRVYAKVVGTKYLGEYKAHDKLDAEMMAADEHSYISLCHQCAPKINDPECVEFTAEEIKPKPTAKKGKK